MALVPYLYFLLMGCLLPAFHLPIKGNCILQRLVFMALTILLCLNIMYWYIMYNFEAKAVKHGNHNQQ